MLEAHLYTLLFGIASLLTIDCKCLPILRHSQASLKRLLKIWTPAQSPLALSLFTKLKLQEQSYPMSSNSCLSLDERPLPQAGKQTGNATTVFDSDDSLIFGCF
jgi:hypothetical protein